MPFETQEAIDWALMQQYEIEEGVLIPVSVEIPFSLVDKVREYFNANEIVYESFGFGDLLNYL